MLIQKDLGQAVGVAASDGAEICRPGPVNVLVGIISGNASYYVEGSANNSDWFTMKTTTGTAIEAITASGAFNICAPPRYLRVRNNDTGTIQGWVNY